MENVVARYRRVMLGGLPPTLCGDALGGHLPADGAPCFAFCASSALVFKRVVDISIHFSLEIAEISVQSLERQSPGWK
jgi:hypothetical protein